MANRLVEWLFPTQRAVSGYPSWMLGNLAQGYQYPLSLNQTLPGEKEEYPTGDFASLAQVYKTNGVVFACMLARLMLFSEARFQFRRMQSGRPGELFGNASLDILEHPWPGGTTGDLLVKMIQHADLAGDSFVIRPEADRLQVLRPDWMSLVIGSPTADDVTSSDIGAQLLGYVYHPDGYYSGKKPVALLRQEVAHFSPLKDPTANYRGMSWLLPVIREVMGDNAAVSHKLRFYEQGATPNLAITFDPAVQLAALEAWVDKFEKMNMGVENAYKPWFLGAGATVVPIGANMQQTDFKAVQGAGETRIAAAAGVPPIIVGLSEGLEAATYANYGQARRRFADGTMRPLWRNVAGSLATIVPPPAGAELWYDDRDIPFLQEDMKDRAAIQSVEAQSMRQLIDAGFDPATVTAAIISGDWSRLRHTGLYSVQLQPPMPEGPPQTPDALAGRALADLVAPYLPSPNGSHEP